MCDICQDEGIKLQTPQKQIFSAQTYIYKYQVKAESDAFSRSKLMPALTPLLLYSALTLQKEYCSHFFHYSGKKKRKEEIEKLILFILVFNET